MGKTVKVKLTENELVIVKQMRDYPSLSIDKKKRNAWFGMAWKFQDGVNENGIPYSGSACYDRFRDFMERFAETHVGCKWAFAYHNKGHNMPDYKHEDCEHLHFVIITENPCYGKSVRDSFPGAYIETVKKAVANCANYLLHNTSTSFDKEYVPVEDLYCSGDGTHGKLWFPLLHAKDYETFLPDMTLHYVFNEGCDHMLKFLRRFGSCVTRPGYCSIINQAISMYSTGTIVESYVEEIYNMLSPNVRFLLHGNHSVDLPGMGSDVDCYSFHDLVPYLQNLKWAHDFMHIVIWLDYTEAPANAFIMELLNQYYLTNLIDVHKERQKQFELVNSGSYNLLHTLNNSGYVEQEVERLVEKRKSQMIKRKVLKSMV